MASSSIKNLDPVQGLIDYIEDIKPYHTKVIESLVEYVGIELIDVTMLEKFLFDIDMVYGSSITPDDCLDDGFGTLGFDSPDVFPIVSPDPGQTITSFPSFTSNSFVLVGDQRAFFSPSNNIIFRITSYTKDGIVMATPGAGSPAYSGSEFYVLGDRTALFSEGTIFFVTDSDDNDGAYIVKGPTGSPSGATVVTFGSPEQVATRIPVENQIIRSNIAGGFVKLIDDNNTGSFASTNVTYTEGTSIISSYTTVYITGMSFTPPAENPDANQKYVSVVGIGNLNYNRVLGYSNALRYFNATAPESLLQKPDEGTVYAPIVNLSQGSPTYFVVEGNYENSNVFVGDEITVTGSTDNNTTYIITDIQYIFEPLISDYATRIGVASIHDPNINGYVKFDIPSNVFIVDGDYSDFFKQGITLLVNTGKYKGKYTVLGSKFKNGETQIRVIEDIINHQRGKLVIGVIAKGGSPIEPENAFVVSGDYTKIFPMNSAFNVISSVRNDGFYTVNSTSYNASTNLTKIYINERIDTTDATGEIHEFVGGSLTYATPGFGETPQLCDVVPETYVKVAIRDKLYINGHGVWASDDIIAHGNSIGALGYDLPLTIFSTTAPTVTVSATEPVSPVEDDLWFDTASNTGSPNGPGTLKLYTMLLPGSPSIGWKEVPLNKIYWNDTTTGYMYYRTVYQYYDRNSLSYPVPSTLNNLDTGWILEYTKVPGYNELIPASSTRINIGSETFIAGETETSVAQTTYILSSLTIPVIGSPGVTDPTLIEVFVNGTRAEFNILSETTFEIITPALSVDDFIEAKIFNYGGLATNTFVGSWDADTSITEDFNMLKGYKFYIDGTQLVSTSPEISKIYIPDTSTGEVYNIFKPITGSPITGSPEVRTLADTTIEITGSISSPNYDGNYTILDAEMYGSPNSHVALTIAGTLPNTGIFGGSPTIESGKALFQQWFQYMIIATGTNSIIVYGDATADIIGGSPAQTIKISHSLGSPNNDGVYSVESAPVFDGIRTTITTIEALTNTGITGGWVESI